MVKAAEFLMVIAERLETGRPLTLDEMKIMAHDLRNWATVFMNDMPQEEKQATS